MGRKIFGKCARNVLVMAASVCVFLAAFPPAASAEESGQAQTGEPVYDAEYVSERISSNYTKVSGAYVQSAYAGETVTAFMKSAQAEAGDAALTDETMNYPLADTALDLTVGDAVRLDIDVPEDGQYFLAFDYLSYDNSVLPIEFSLRIDGVYLFYECRSVTLNSMWIPGENPAYDRYGDQTVTVPDKAIRWERDYFFDSSYRHSAPLAVELSAGKHRFLLSVNSGAFLLGAVLLCAPFETPEYTGSETAKGGSIIEIQGEAYSSANDSSIHAALEYDSSIQPYEVKNTVLNTLDSDSFNKAGQTVTYSFAVEEAGYYYIAMNYRQSDKTDFPVFVDIRVDGGIPGAAFESYAMNYTSDYKTETLGDDEGNCLSVYLERGEHTVSCTISINAIRYVLESLDEIISAVNDTALEITKVAGTNSDKYRDLKLSRYIPNLEKTLYIYADKLRSLEKSALVYSGRDKNVAVMSSMLIAAEQLVSLADNPDEILYRVAELSSSMNSVNHHLANTVDNLLENGLAIDRIWIYQEDAKLPKRPNFFKSLWMSVSRFLTSFTERSYSTSNTDPEHLQVWVNRSNQYVRLMQKMIDERFTPETGIEVDISIMPDQYKLVLANSSGSAPDVATGINYTIPYELAVRGALSDMTQFEGFRETASVYEPGFFLTGTINDSIYSMPETMNFWVLFCRTDVLEKLGLQIPDTMDDVIAMLPELQMRGLNFYYPTAGMLAMRNFHGTTPLIVQNGGSLYFGTAQEGTALGGENSVKGFNALTDLFTIYDLPVNIDSFYQHFRNGDLPLGIADYTTYNLVRNAAPELSSSWKISLAPGTAQEDGSVNRSTCGCMESTVIFKSGREREQKAWRFIQWWSSTEAQAEFGQTIQIIYGDEYLWPTANVEALAQLPIDSGDKQILLEYAKNVVDVARVPGTYMLEREMSNAFNSIVVGGENEQSRIDKAVKNINREIDRKMEEFGFTDASGNVIEAYRIPTVESVKALLGRED
ncbi:MAG: extracellular solute-binding protein [Oscillospiraceae bacterium]|jgi:ABC-type glycerol-3-phosphate transport system substrate-binding protein|nr:extracellular solute-binding protein [Oscillospiraceae bacterium]